MFINKNFYRTDFVRYLFLCLQENKKIYDIINDFYKILNNKIDIIGVGGVDSGETAYQKLIHGAKFVQLYTGMVFQGPKIVNKISDELNNILETNNVKKLTDIIGKI